MRWVGRSLPRSEDRYLVRGLGRFTADVACGAAAVVFVRSPIARGRILGIEAPSGGLVVTAADLAGVRPIRPLLQRPDYVPLAQPVLARDRVAFVGEPIAAVVADCREAAEDLAERVVVEIEPEAAVIGLERAAAPGAPLVHPGTPGNVIVSGSFESEGFAEAWAGAAEIVELVVRTRRQAAVPLEARAGHAALDRRTGRLTLTASVQMPHVLRTGIADCLGVPESRLRVVAPDVGGAFGQKMSLIPEYVVLAWLALRWDRPVAWIEDRRENLIASFHSREQRHRVRGAFGADGRLLALEADILCDIGAYSCYPVTCGVEPLMALAEFPGPYDLRAYKVRARGVATNSCPMAPYRGVSRPAITLSLERLMDYAAERLGLDPVTIRDRNLVHAFPYRSVTGITYDQGSYREALALAAQAIDVASFRRHQREARARGRFPGVGFAVFNERSGYGTPAFAARAMEITPGYERVALTMDPSGDVTLAIGASPHGQGLAQALAQLVADELALTPDRVRVVHGDTDACPYGWGTFASRSMVIAGGAAKRAAAALAERLRRLGGQLLQSPAEALALADGAVVRRDGGGGIAIAELARAAYHRSHQFADDDERGLAVVACYDPPGTYSNACHAAIVEVDPETGGVCVERFVAVEDAGLLINPMIADGQIRGGIAQGIANALYEEIVYDDEGNILTGSLADYAVPTVAEIPAVEIHHLESATEASITGAKGLGEGGAIGAPAAVLNAVNDALAPFGARLDEMPATPRRIHAALSRARGERS